MSRLRSTSDAPLFLWVLAAYPVIFIAAANPGQAPAASVVAVALVAELGATAVLALVRPLLPSWRHAALVAVSVVIVAFAFGPLHATLETAALDALEGGGKPLLGADRLGVALSIAAVLAITACGWLVARLSAETVRRLSRAFNVAALVLAVSVTMLLVSQREAGSAARRDAAGTRTERTAAPADAPDIYYILLDGYARHDVLAQHYGFDNRAFVEGLRARGFAVSDASTSNYYWTFLSLASALNFRYLEDIAGKPLDPGDTDRSMLYRSIQDNAAASFLRARGYRTVHVQSTWGATRDNPYADLQVRCAGGVFGDEFRRAVWDASWFRVLTARASADLALCHVSNFEAVAGLAANPGPKFVFAHFLLPHHPYLFDSAGRVLRDANMSSQFEFQKRLWEDRKAYVEQLRYVNARMLTLVDTLVAASPRRPIILIQSDHGPNLRKDLPGPEQMRIRFANFSAHYLPGAPASLIPTDDTPVNLFRRVFNHYFGAGLEILPTRHFHSNYGRPLQLREVASDQLATQHAKASDSSEAPPR